MFNIFKPGINSANLKITDGHRDWCEATECLDDDCYLHPRCANITVEIAGLL